MEIAGIPYLWERNLAWVVLPLPGGPTSRMTFEGGACAKAPAMAMVAPSIAAVTERIMVADYRCAARRRGLRTFPCLAGGKEGAGSHNGGSHSARRL